MATIEELEKQLKTMKLEREIKEEMAKGKSSGVEKAVKVKAKVKAKPQKKKGFFSPRGTESQGIDFLMKM